MSETIGRVDFIASLDGRNTPRQAKKVGEEAGASASSGFDKEFEKGFRESLSKSGRQAFDTWDKNGRKSGSVYARGLSARLDDFVRNSRTAALDAARAFEGIRLDTGFLDDFAKGFEDSDAAAAKLNEQMDLLGEKTNVNAKALGAARKQIDDWAASQREASLEAERHGAALAEQSRLAEEQSNRLRQQAEEDKRSLAIRTDLTKKLQAAFAETTDEVEDLTDATERSGRAADGADTSFRQWYRGLSANTRQWTLIIGAIASGAEDIAVLGSAAGAGLLAVGGAATAAIGGVGALAAILVTLNKDLDDLPPSLRDAAREFDGFKSAFTDLRETITQGAVSGGIGSAFAQMADTVHALAPEFYDLGQVAGGVLDDLAISTRVGSDGFDEIRKAVHNATGDFDSLAGTVGTFAGALLRGVNRANPLVQDLLGYVDELADRFDDFTRSNSFDDWMRNAETTFSHLGPLLDATGRLLNDLVTPESVNRTADFLDSLTDFMPTLTDILNVLGAANPFGLLAQGLDEAGNAIDPLLPAVEDLAEALSGVLQTALPVVSAGLESVATAATPVVQGLADIVDAIPEPWIEQITAGLLGLAGGFAVLKGVQGVQGALTAIQAFTTEATTATTVAGSLGSSLKSNLGKAGLAGAAAVGLVAVAGAIQGVIEELNGWEDSARNAVGSNKGLADSADLIYKNLTYMGKEIEGNALSTDNLSGALARLTAENANGGEFFAGFTIGASEFGDAAHDLRATLGQLDEPLANLAQTDLSAATGQFAAWAQQAQASDEQVLAMLESMPKFKESLEQVALQSGQVATDQDLLTLALGRTTVAQRDADYAARQNSQALAEMEGKSGTAGDAIDGLSDKIRNFGSATLDTRSAEREFQAAIDDATESVIANGTSLDTNTAEGRANQAALDDIAQSALEFAAATYDQTGSVEGATSAVQQGRDALIEQMKQMGWTQEAAEDYANQLGLIPSNIDTIINLDDSKARGAMDRFWKDFNGRTLYVNVGARTPGGLQAYASGGMLYGPTHILAGEAGTEAIVPMDRPLSQVDPDVRWLSAIAQGKAAPPSMASGGMVGGRQLTVNEGAIVVNESGDPRRAANEVLQRLAENVVG